MLVSSLHKRRRRKSIPPLRAQKSSTSSVSANIDESHNSSRKRRSFRYDLDEDDLDEDEEYIISPVTTSAAMTSAEDIDIDDEDHDEHDEHDDEDEDEDDDDDEEEEEESVEDSDEDDDIDDEDEDEDDDDDDEDDDDDDDDEEFSEEDEEMTQHMDISKEKVKSLQGALEPMKLFLSSRLGGKHNDIRQSTCTIRLTTFLVWTYCFKNKKESQLIAGNLLIWLEEIITKEYTLIDNFSEYLEGKGYSASTIKSFLFDLR
jgi:hypothetical protein